MHINIDKVKNEVEKNSRYYMVGIKFVTNEDARTICESIKKDMRIYDITGFTIRGNIIDLMLSDNAILCSYYFTNKEVLDEIAEKLKEYCSQPRPSILIH